MHHTPTGKLIAALQTGHKPTASELAELMTALHDAVLDTPLMLWLDRSFEDVSDSVHRAMVCAEQEQQLGEPA